MLENLSKHISVFQAVTADPLHQIEGGIFGQHIWEWIKELFEENSSSASQLDDK